MAFFRGMRYRSSQQDLEPSETITQDMQHVRKRRKRTARFRFAIVAVIILVVVMLLGVVSFAFLSSRNGARGNPAALGIWSVGSHSMRRTNSQGSTRDNDEQKGSLESASSSLDCIPSPLGEREATPEYGCEEMEEMLGLNFTFLGDGFWRNVYLTKFRGRDVVYKELKEERGETSRNIQRHRWEAAALEAVSNHENIVGLLGRCGTDIVTEYYPLSMDKLIFGEVLEDGQVKRPKFNARKVIGMALDAARGLEALHEAPGGPIIHADLQPKQLLLDDKWVVKINDLNRCRFLDRDAAGRPCPVTIKRSNGVWRSPEEYLDGQRLTEKIDVYSMGMIFWSMLGRDAPFEKDKEQYYKDRVIGGERPNVNPRWNRDFVELFQDMWQGEPSRRPSAGEVVRRLEDMLRALPTRSDTNDWYP